MASTSASVAGTMTMPSTIALLLQLHFGFRQPNVDRRRIAIRVETVRSDDVQRALRTAQGDVLPPQHVRDTDRIGRNFAAEVRRLDFTAVVIDRYVELASARIIDDHRAGDRQRNRFVRGHRAYRLA